MGAPEAKAMMRADNRKLRGDLAKSRSMFRRSFGKIGKGIKGSLTGGLGALGVGAGLGGIALIGRDVLKFEDTLNRLSIQSGVTGADLDKFKSDLVQLSGATGISRNELIGASEALVNLTGRAGFSADKLAVLAEANLATGASMEELAGLSFSLDKAFGLKNAGELKQGLSAIIQAGKDGAIPLNQMASVLQNVSASFAELGGKGVDGAADLASALQVLRGGGFASASEAGTGLQSIITALTKKAAKLRKEGINVFDSDGKFTGLRSILDDFQAANLSTEKLTKILGRVEAGKAIKALTSPEGRKNFEKFAEVSKRSNAVEEDAAKRRQSTAFKLQKSINRLKETFAKVFTPERLEKFVMAMGKIADFAGFIVDHAKEFALIWASIKIGSFAAQMASIATSAASAATGAAGMASGVGRAAGFLSKAAGSLAALSAGFAIGTFLDEKFGLSDKISKKAAEAFGPSKGFQESGFLRDRSKDVRSASGLAGIGAGAFVDGGQALKDASDLLFQAKTQGIVGKGGSINKLNAAKATVRDGINPIQEQFIKSGAAPLPQETQRLIESIETAQRLVAEAQAQRRKGLDVRVIVEDGRVPATGVERTGGVE